MSIPFFPFPFWLEVLYRYQSTQSSLYETKRILGLALRLQLAQIPISDCYGESPELDTWGFEPAFPLLSSDDGMKLMVSRLERLATALSKPDSLIGWALQNSANRSGFLACAAVGEYICRNYGGMLELTVRSRDGDCHAVTLATDLLQVEYIRDRLKSPRDCHYQIETSTVTGIDLGRGLVYTLAGALQFRDPDVASQAISLMEKSVEMELDTGAPAVRVSLPELVALRRRK